jgi:hypothetical protein
MTRLRLVLPVVLVATLVAGLSLSSILKAQTLSSSAALSGTVSDPSGARVPKATVKLTDSEKGITRAASAGSAGEFSFALLPAGTYTLEATGTGFKTSRQTGIVLNVGDSLSLNIQLTIGAMEQISVTASGPMLQTEDANVSTEIASKQVEELPLNLRNVVGLVMLNSSVNNQTQQQNLAAGGAEDTADQDMSFLTFGGGYFGTTAFILDGGWNVAGGWGGVVYVPSVDDIQEFKVTSNSFSAEYGWSTGNVVNMITKSGTSNFHLVLDEYLRNQALDANTYFDNLDGIAKTPDHRNQFGAAGGGPLYLPGIYKQRDKTFFFANYEGLRLNNSSSFSAVVPTTAQEGGDFSSELTTNQTGTDALGRPIFAGAIYNPYTTRQVLAISGPNAGKMVTIRDPYPGNKIPGTGPGAIDALAAKFAGGNYWPAPANPGAGFNFNTTASQATSSNEYGVRIDHNFNANNRIYGRWSQKFETKSGTAALYGANDIAGPEVFNPDNRYSIVLGGTHVFSPTFIMTGNVEYNRWVEGNNTQSFGFKSSTLGLPAIIDTYSPQFPQVDFLSSNYAPLGATANFGQAHFPNNIGSASIDLNKTFGPHSLSFGYMGAVIQEYGGRISPTRFNFADDKTAGPDPNNATAGTGDAFASFMAGAGTNIPGDPYSGFTGFNAFPASQYYLHGGYVQDDWKVNPKFTLNLGFRYEVQTPITARTNNQAYFDFHALNPISVAAGMPVNGEIVFSTPGNRDLYHFNYDDLAPRIGFAYNVAPKLVLRGGWGLYYSRNYYGGGPSPGYSQQTNWISSVDGITIAQPLAQAFSSGVLPVTGNALGGLTNVGQAGGGINPYHPDPRIKQFVGGIQYAFTSNDLLDVNYVGNRGTRIIVGGINYGQLNPSYLAMGSALNNPVADPFTPALNSLGLPGMSCETSPGSGMLPQAQLLEPYPEFCGGASAGQEPVGFSNYNSLQANFTHRVSLGLIFMASYTYAKFLDDTDGPEGWASISSGGATIRNYYDLKAEKSVDGTDVPQSLALNYVYELPFGRGKKFGSNMNGIEDAVLGGWQVSGITHVQGGFPLSIGNANANAGSLWGGNQHADLTGASFKTGTCGAGTSSSPGIPVGAKYCFFNPAAFSQAPAYTFGDAPRYFSNLRAPGYVDEDLGIQKWFTLTEKFRMQFTAQMFNAFNHANFDSPDINLGDSTMGESSNTQGARQVQLSLKIVR